MRTPLMALSQLTRTPEQLDAILRSGCGSLVETPYPILLLALALREKSAVLALQRNQLQKEIVFAEGSPIDCESNIATETFGRFLVSSGKLSEQDYRTALGMSTARGVAFEEILVEQNLLPSTDLSRLLQQSLARKLLDPFSWKSGTFEISFEDPSVESAQRVKVPQLVLTGILKVETQENVDEAIAFATDMYLGLASEPLFDLDDIRLTSDQQKVIDAAREGTRLSEFATQSGIDGDDVNRIVYALLLLGSLTVTETPVRAAPLFELDHPFRKSTIEERLPPIELPASESAVGSRRSAVEPAPKPASERASADEVIATHLAHRRKDAFDLLEVAETDGPLQFVRAFLRMSDRFLPSKFEESTPDGLREKAQEVFLAAARAYAQLADPVRREALLAGRTKKADAPEISQTTLIVPAPVVEVPEELAPKPVSRPSERKPLKAAVIDPELLYRNGRELADSGKLREALSSFEMASECDAQNGTYAAEVAWCRFRMQVSPATTTLKMLKNAIRIDPRSGVANLYAGKVATALGERAEASAYLDRAAMLMPRDMRVVEALKILR